MHPNDVIVMTIDDPNYLYFPAIGDQLIVLNDVACNANVKPLWQHQVPTFVNRGRVTPPTVAPVSTYLLNEVCITFIKRYWGDCESKDALYNNEHRNVILKEVVGSVDKGWQVHQDITDDAYEAL
jgi:hypothetical protein